LALYNIALFHLQENHLRDQAVPQVSQGALLTGEAVVPELTRHRCDPPRLRAAPHHHEGEAGQPFGNLPKILKLEECIGLTGKVTKFIVCQFLHPLLVGKFISSINFFVYCYLYQKN
jgi:hypothetical protein